MKNLGKKILIFLLSLCIFFSGCISQHITIGSEPISTNPESLSPSDRTLAIVTEVIDGDTITIKTGEKIRLLGIDAPELGKPYYDEAKDRLNELVGNKVVILEKDAVEKDKYDRLLRYVFINNEDNICVKLVREGLAKVYIVLPSVRYKYELEQAENEAKSMGRGIWSPIVTIPPPTKPPIATPYPSLCVLGSQNNLPVISWRCVDQYIGKEVIVEGKILFTNDTGKICYLDFDLNWKNNQKAFVAVIFPKNYALFPGKPDIYFKNRTVRVRGYIQLYPPVTGRPEIIIENPSQIWVIG